VEVRLFFWAELAMSESPDDPVRDNLNGPAMARTQRAEVTTHRITEQIAGVNFLAANEAVKTRRKGLRRTRLVNPGTVF
jgi:hypothetical protein